VGVFTKPLFPPLVLQGKITLLLDAIQDPGNMGTIIRCADWFGVEQIICSKECADAFSPKVIQSTMGSIARVHVLYSDLHEFMRNNETIPVYAATLEGKNVFGHSPVKEAMVLIGNESKGIDESLLNLCQHQITIPRKGKAESLNAAVATGIILSHLAEFEV
jgi:TrmH family RNA methyltransferase